MPTMRVYASESAWVQKDIPLKNNSVDDYLLTGWKDQLLSESAKALCRFDFSSYLNRKRALSMTIQIYVKLWSLGEVGRTDDPRIFCDEIEESWEEKRVNYSNAPKCGDGISGTDREDLTGNVQERWFAIRKSAISENVIKNGIYFWIWLGYYFKMASSRSVNKPYADIEYEPVTIYPTNLNPASGRIDETAENTFSWEAGYDKTNVIGSITQRSAVLQWRDVENPSIIREVTTGNSMRVTIPPNTLPNKAFEWRVKITSNDSVEGPWSAWNRIETVDTEKTTAVNLSPNMAYVDGQREMRFSWSSVSPLGTRARGFDIQKSKDGTTWENIIHKETHDQFYDVPANYLSGGLMFWRVRTYNSDNIAGEWSESAQINIIAPPTAPNIISVTNKNFPTIKWAAQGQRGYQIQICIQSMIVYDTEIKAGSENEHRVKNALENGEYIVKLRIAGENELMSEWCEYRLTISTVPRISIRLIGEQNGNAARITWSVLPQEDVGRAWYIVRDDKTIAKISGQNEYLDHTASGTHKYKVRAISDDEISDSNAVVIWVKLPCITLAPADTPADMMLCRYSTERGSEKIDKSRTKTLLHLSGRKKPVSIESEFEDKTISFVYAEPDATLHRKLEKMYDKGGVFIYRSPRGEAEYVALDALSYKHMGNIRVYTVTAHAIDYDGCWKEYEGYSQLVALAEPFYVKDE